MAGEIIALGDGVKNWKVGDRVCANFVLDHIYGDTNYAIQRTSMGGQAHGTLTQYRTFPSHVRASASAIVRKFTYFPLPVPGQIPRFLELRGSINITVGLANLVVALPKLKYISCAALTAYNALNGPRRIKAGDHVLVLGTGGVSMYAFAGLIFCARDVLTLGNQVLVFSLP
jgi:NADPH:quinone reductase-like Zn-dependent oxidoreductase